MTELLKYAQMVKEPSSDDLLRFICRGFTVPTKVEKNKKKS